MFGISQKDSLENFRDELLKHEDLTREQISWLQSLNLSIHKKEVGYLENGVHYLRVGLSAMASIQKVLEAASQAPPKAILDYPAGFGRVLRFLKVAFPDARINAAEIDAQAVKFFRSAFRVPAWLCKANPDLNQGRDTYDLVWCGSLLTHSTSEQIERILRYFFRSLNPGGTCVFTTHGEKVEGLLGSGEITYSLPDRAVQDLLKQFRKTGFGFVDYEPAKMQYGISLSSDDCIRHLAQKAGDWNCTYFQPAGWDNHQDVYGFTKASN